MIKVYFDHANPRVVAHSDVNCSEIQKHQMQGQRYTRIDVNNLSTELNRIISKHQSYRFGNLSPLTNFWLEIDFGDYDFEVALAKYIKICLGKHYTPILNCQFRIHC